MVTALPLESLNPSTGSGETELEVQTTEHAELPMDLIQPTFTEDQMDDLIQNRPPSIWQKWIYYVVSWIMLFSGFAVIIAGMTSRHDNGWGLAFIL
jgi:hypothetical protein